MNGDHSEMNATEPLTEPVPGSLAQLLEAASAPPLPEELAGEAEARAMFTAEFASGSRNVIPLNRPSGRLISARTKAAAALVAGVIVLGGGAAAAQSGRLPGPVQSVVHATLAHVGLAVPDADRSPAPTETDDAPGSTTGSTTATTTHQAPVTPPHPSGTGPGTGQTVCTVTSNGQCNPDPGKPADPGSQANPDPGKPTDPGSQANPDPGKPTDPGSQANPDPGKPADPGKPTTTSVPAKTHP